MRRFLFAAALISCLFPLACGTAEGIEQRAYFKNDHGDRIKTFELMRPVSAAAVEAHARALMAPSGTMAAAYYFDRGSTIPRDGVTLAKSVFDANRVLYNVPGISRWRYAYMVSLNGATEFVDCAAASKHALCRSR